MAEQRPVYAGAFSAWAPGLGGFENKDAWLAWARGEGTIADSSEAPTLTFTDPLFRRRLSQLCKMTVQVVHDVLAGTVQSPEDLPAGLAADIPLYFVSFRGEQAQQFKINRMLIEEAAITPAAFSNSVFNAPIALASIALGLRAGYQALYPAGPSFALGLLAAAAPLLAGTAEEVLLVYGDERPQEDYGSLLKDSGNVTAAPLPLAFAVRLSLNKGGVPLSPETAPASPEAFLRHLLLDGS